MKQKTEPQRKLGKFNVAKRLGEPHFIPIHSLSSNYYHILFNFEILLKPIY
jgi:hypothetical protein